MPQFLVGGIDSDFYELDFALVEAETEHDAVSKYVLEVEARTNLVIEVIADRSIHMGWVERFFLSTAEEQAHYFQHRTPPVAWEPVVKERVRRFFGTRQDWARLYTDFYENETLEDPEAYVRENFPREMIACMLLDTDWRENYLTVALNQIRSVS